jgi:hypothetical protein
MLGFMRSRAKERELFVGLFSNAIQPHYHHVASKIFRSSRFDNNRSGGIHTALLLHSPTSEPNRLPFGVSNFLAAHPCSTTPMPEYAEIYSLHRTRCQTVIDTFIGRFMAGGEVATDEFVLPPNAALPEHSFQTVWDLIEHCCRHTEQSVWIPWRAASGCRPEHGSIEFLADGSLVFGLATDSFDQDYVDELAEQLAAFDGAVATYITHEDRSPETTDAFEDFVRSLPVVQADGDKSDIRSSRARKLCKHTFPSSAANIHHEQQTKH